MNKQLVASLCVCASLLSTLSAQLIPGDQEHAPAVAIAAGGMPTHLKVPYIATEYVRPVVTTDDEVKIRFFVTDWDNSLVRFGDESFRFDVEINFSADAKNWTTRGARGLRSGDHSISLGKLAAGDYQFSIQCRDAQGRQSHVVWHEFLVRRAADLIIPEKQIYRMETKDLQTYGILNNGPSGKIIPVEIGSLEGLTGEAVAAHITKCLDEALKNTSVPANNYIVLAAAQNGTVTQYACQRSRVVYGAAYDKALVETNAVRTAEGLQKLLDDAAERGISKVVLLPGLYRMSASKRISIPNRFTLDLNGATLKMNEFTGDKGAVVEILHKTDSHLINGIIEGDYYEHDYANSPNYSEWVMGIEMMGDCRYCSFENLEIRNIAGYGVGNGTAPYDHAYPGIVGINDAPTPYLPGAINLSTGEIDASVSGMFTSDFSDIQILVTNDYLSVSQYLGYQGMLTKSWIFLAGFYDVDKKFISGETSFQYRLLPIPKKAAYLRISVVEESAERAHAASLSVQRFKMPWNCTFRNLVITRCRAVGMAPAAMRNMLIEGCDFSYSGETLATCAFDAEDGWDMMQDVTIRNNVFHDNPRNELLTCAGHNFIIEGNTARIHLWDRTNSPLVRNNTFSSASFLCGNRNRTMHGRYENNSYRDSVGIGSDDAAAWDIVISGPLASSNPEGVLNIGCGATGRFRDVQFGPIMAYGGNFDRCTFDRAHFIMTYVNQTYKNCSFQNTQFQHLNQTNRFEKCSITDSTMIGMSGGNLTLKGCTITDLTLTPDYWARPNTFQIEDCTVTNKDASFLSSPIYSVASVLLKNSVFSTGGAPVIQFHDLRAQPTDTQPAFVAVENCTVQGTSPAVIGVSAQDRDVVKEVTLRGASNKLPEEMVLILPADLRETWKLEGQK